MNQKEAFPPLTIGQHFPFSDKSKQRWQAALSLKSL